MWNELKRVWGCRDVLFHLTSSDLKAAHRHKLLGNLWALLDPLLMMLVLYFVFAHLRAREKGPEFALYLLSGLIVWNFFTHNLTQSPSVIRRQKSLIHKVPLPMTLFPLSNMLRHLHDLKWGLAAYAAIKLFTQAPVDSFVHFVWFPIILVFFCLFTLGLSLIFACLGVFLVDVTNILAVALRLGFFLNPIFWTMNELIRDDRMKELYLLLNPIGGYLMLFRNSLLSEAEQYQVALPGDYYLPYLALVSVGVFLIGLVVFHSARGHYAKYI